LRNNSVVKLAIPLVIGALALSACGSKTTPAVSGGSNATATIGLIAPLTGGLSALGLGMEHAVDLAVKQANASNAIPGWTLKFNPQDDTADPTVGQQAASTLASDTTTIGVVGTLNSSVAQTVAPVLDQANVVMVSPANTNPTLTLGPNWLTAQTRPHKNYFRVCATDAIQGPFAADYLIAQGIKKVVTIDDQKTYGAGLVGTFTTEFKLKGGTVLGHDTITDTDTDFSAVITKAKALNPQAVYYGGEYPQAGPLASQMHTKGLTVPLMGGDGIFDPKFIQLAGAGAPGDFATSVGADTATSASAQKFVTDYKAASYADAYSAYGAYAYDAANAIIAAAKVALVGKTSVDDTVRQAVIAAMASVSITGATGAVAFDKYGDTTNKVLTVYGVTAGAWVTKETKAF
jgi:branched-chain amino acid transport system substrate-binding protein